MGGDGTAHEVVNGLLLRDDKKKVPVGFLPNGSGNDLCASIELRDFSKALGSIVKGNSIKMDLFEALLDHETEEEVKEKAREVEGFDTKAYLRYCCLNT